jgi:hypothetical protein
MRSTASTVLLALLLLAPLPARALDPFYVDLLRDGMHAYDRADFTLAAKDLRLACFGLLDDPKALASCLGRLALAQDKAPDVAGFRETFRRLVELEERFQAYSQADLPPEVRAVLEQRFVVQIPAPTLESSPQAFRALVKKPAPQPAPSPAAKGTAARPRESPQAPAPAAPQPAAPATKPPPPASSPSSPSPPAGKEPAPRPISRPPSPSLSGPLSRPLSEDEKGKLESVRKALGETGKGKELRQVFQTAREVADAHPESVDAQRLAGEAAYRLSHWSDAAAYLQHGGGLPDSEPELLFYLAVSLYESGDRPGAAAALRRSLPNLQRTPYVDAYARKIIGR